MVTRQDVVDVIKSWKGMREKDGSFKPIIDIYNTIKPLPAGYILKYTDSWCAGTVSAAYQQAKAADIFPCECSCARMITKAKQMGIWVEDDGYTPKIGDAVLYDWQDSGYGDNTGTPDHVGMVIEVNKAAKSFVVMEGNKDDAVGTRTMSINGKYIRGFVTPKFPEVKEEKVVSTQTITVSSGNTKTTTQTQPVQEPAAGVIPAKNVETYQTGTLSKVPAGSVLKLNKTPMYASSSAKKQSSTKTGTYYIWSVDTVNGKVRITNAKKNVGVKGQVTGWITVDDAIKYATESAKPPVTSDTPSYQVGAVYVTQVSDLTVRQGPGTSYSPVGYAGLTANAKKHDKDKDGCLDINTKVTCQEVKITGANVWIRIPSGWIAAYYNKKYYVK